MSNNAEHAAIHVQGSNPVEHSTLQETPVGENASALDPNSANPQSVVPSPEPEFLLPEAADALLHGEVMATVDPDHIPAAVLEGAPPPQEDAPEQTPEFAFANNAQVEQSPLFKGYLGLDLEAETDNQFVDE